MTQSFDLLQMSLKKDLLGVDTSKSNLHEGIFQDPLILTIKMKLKERIDDEKDIEQIMEAIDYLNLTKSEVPFPNCSSTMDSLCVRMSDVLQYKDHERDMVILHHKLEVSGKNVYLTLYLISLMSPPHQLKG